MVKIATGSACFDKKGNIGAIPFKAQPAKVVSNSPKYCSNLIFVPIGSTAFTKPEKINQTPQKFCKKVIQRAVCHFKA